MEKILALVVMDNCIASLLKYLQKVLSDYPINSQPHITIRGPYANKRIRKNTIDKINSSLNNIGNIILSEVDYFKIDDNLFNVYFSVLNDKLKEITRKRDYPIHKFGFNPHITLCKTNDKNKADKIKDIFNKNKIELNISSDKFELREFEVGKSEYEFKFHKYEPEEVLTNNNENFKFIINLVKDAFQKI
jgi:2'-5' RNA ligase